MKGVGVAKWCKRGDKTVLRECWEEVVVVEGRCFEKVVEL